jgi:hypothetical protein
MKRSFSLIFPARSVDFTCEDSEEVISTEISIADKLVQVVSIIDM